MIRKIDDPHYQQGFTEALNGGKLRDLVNSIDLDDTPALETKDSFGAGPSRFVGFIDGILQRLVPLKP